MAPKRARATPSQSTQSTQSTQDSAAAQPPPAKRAKVASAVASASKQPEVAAGAATVAQPLDKPTLALPKPTKRQQVPGTLRRLSTGHPSQAKGVRPTATLSGAKVGGKSKDLRDGFTKEEMWITRKGLGFGGYLKKGVAAFTERGCTCLALHSMGAAMPMALSLAMAIRDAVPGGAEHASDAGVVDMKVTTGTAVVADEVEPDDEDEDIVYQTRSKSTVSIELSLSPELARAIVAGAGVVPGGRGNGSTRGGKRRGGGSSRGGRGRGRGGGTTA